MTKTINVIITDEDIHNFKEINLNVYVGNSSSRKYPCITLDDPSTHIHTMTYHLHEKRGLCVPGHNGHNYPIISSNELGSNFIDDTLVQDFESLLAVSIKENMKHHKEFKSLNVYCSDKNWENIVLEFKKKYNK